MFGKAGFVDVQVDEKRWPTNCWLRRRTLIGRLTLCTLGKELESVSLARFARGLGWRREETTALCAKALKDFSNRNLYAYFNFYVVSGRKPTDQSSHTSA